MRKFPPEGALLINTLIWGATFVIIKNALGYISPMMFIALRFSLAAIFVLPFVYKSIPKINKSVLKGGLILGILYFLGFAIQTIGLKYTTATKSGFITGTFVVFIPILQLIIEKRAPGKWSIVGILSVLIGLILLSSKGDSFLSVFYELGNDFNIGDLLTLICAVLFALYIVYLDVISKKHEHGPLVFLQIIITAAGGLLAVYPLTALNLDVFKFNLTSDVVFALGYTAILATVITTILQTKYQKFVAPTKAGIIFSFEPIFSAILAYFIIGEITTTLGWIGGLFIFSGLIVSEVFDKKN